MFEMVLQDKSLAYKLTFNLCGLSNASSNVLKQKLESSGKSLAEMLAAIA
jgi:hypothetical protein